MSSRLKFTFILITFFIGLSSAFSAQAATQIFRSVGPGATGVLANDGSHARTVTLTGGVATFSVALADNIGVGDAVIIDTGGTDQAIDASDTLLFIHSRASSTSYTLRTHTGATPSDISINDTYSIYRAYTSLANAEAGTKNTSIPIVFNGGNRDLVTNDEQWNIACYANGTTADTTAVTVEGWTTDVDNFIKIYTPTLSTEVGVSQRHSGKPNGGNYIINPPSSHAISINISNVSIFGLEITDFGATGNTASGIVATGMQNIIVGYNFIHDEVINNNGPGIGIEGASAGANLIFNNIVSNVYNGMRLDTWSGVFILCL